ncbi:hypothetical protein GWK47_033332 [Chionoecetes opilio]|uniref:Uncharacterized protein n=1 Tax=Chionoecetes opilio TaxID=41210 RepID=A0A8J5D0C4_CHIOP|nr:hypothetical protein GWK47_033332 [Chionoecetes opilio]
MFQDSAQGRSVAGLLVDFSRPASTALSRRRKAACEIDLGSSTRGAVDSWSSKDASSPLPSPPFCSGLMCHRRWPVRSGVFGKGIRDGAAWHVPRPRTHRRSLFTSVMKSRRFGCGREILPIPVFRVTRSQRTQLDDPRQLPPVISSWSGEEQFFRGRGPLATHLAKG